MHCNTLQFSAVLWNVLYYATIQCSAVPCTALHYTSTVECSTVHCSALQYGCMQYPALHCTTLQSSAVQCTDMYYSTVACSIVHCSVLHYSCVHYDTLTMHIAEHFLAHNLFKTPLLIVFLKNYANFLWHFSKYLIDKHNKNHKSRKISRN